MKNHRRKIKRLDEIPEWFDLANYDAAKKLDVGAWSIHLIARSSLLEVLHSNVPITDQYKEETINSLKQPVMTQLAGRNWTEDGSIWPITVDEVFTLARVLISQSDKFERLWNIYATEKLEIITDPFQFLWGDLGQELAYSHIPDFSNNSQYRPWTKLSSYITIDFSATDEQLVTDFKFWLAECRDKDRELLPPKKEFSGEKIFTQEKLNKWVDYKLLPYLDLTIWAEFENAEMTHSLMGRVLFPDEYEIATPDRIRRTIREKALFLLKPETIRALTLQAQMKTGKIS